MIILEYSLKNYVVYFPVRLFRTEIEVTLSSLVIHILENSSQKPSYCCLFSQFSHSFPISGCISFLDLRTPFCFLPHVFIVLSLSTPFHSISSFRFPLHFPSSPTHSSTHTAQFTTIDRIFLFNVQGGEGQTLPR